MDFLKSKNDLLNSVLLWNGYASHSMGNKSQSELWDFGVYMEKIIPYLSNYFERAFIYLMSRLARILMSAIWLDFSMVITDPPEGCWKLLTEEVSAR